MEIFYICNLNFHKANKPEKTKKSTIADTLGVNKINPLHCLVQLSFSLQHI